MVRVILGQASTGVLMLRRCLADDERCERADPSFAPLTLATTGYNSFPHPNPTKTWEVRAMFQNYHPDAAGALAVDSDFPGWSPLLLHALG